MSYGRRRIFTDETEISTENVIAEVEATFLVHSSNSLRSRTQDRTADLLNAIAPEVLDSVEVA